MPQRKPNPIARGYFWLAERLYNELAQVYDPVSWMVSLGQWATVRNWALDYLIGQRVLEIGFGTGELLLEMSRRNLQAYGLDDSAAMQRIAAAKLHRQRVWVPCVRGRAQQLPFAEDSFDAIVSTFPAGYIFDLATWQEAARVLRTPGNPKGACGGRFIVIGIGISPTAKPFSQVTQYFFGLSMEDLLARFRKLEHLTALEVRVIMRKQLGLEIPVLIAEKRG